MESNELQELYAKRMSLLLQIKNIDILIKERNYRLEVLEEWVFKEPSDSEKTLFQLGQAQIRTVIKLLEEERAELEAKCKQITDEANKVLDSS